MILYQMLSGGRMSNPLCQANWIPFLCVVVAAQCTRAWCGSPAMTSGTAAGGSRMKTWAPAPLGTDLLEQAQEQDLLSAGLYCILLLALPVSHFFGLPIPLAQSLSAPHMCSGSYWPQHCNFPSNRLRMPTTAAHQSCTVLLHLFAFEICHLFAVQENSS